MDRKIKTKINPIVIGKTPLEEKIFHLGFTRTENPVVSIAKNQKDIGRNPNQVLWEVEKHIPYGLEIDSEKVNQISKETFKQ